LSLFGKVERQSVFRMSIGSEFQTFGAATTTVVGLPMQAKSEIHVYH